MSYSIIAQGSLRPCVLKALSHLKRAREYARDTDADPWQFAVDWRYLKTEGVDRNDLRWLISRGYAEMQRELSLPAAIRRIFAVHDVPRISQDAAFVLTDAGDELVRSLEKNDARSTPPAPDRDLVTTSSFADAAPTGKAKPKWDRDRRELSFRGQIVKIFRVPAPNQGLILEAFEEESWPEFIDDPLRSMPDQDPHRRLQSTIKSLNRHQTNSLLRFRGNGGEKVFWCEHTG